ncbi:hypothetical protein S101446_02728 [Komagataeibacter europaeus]|nr:hypothetical protein S101446_02728 [Komagataeibacter europaeus]
MLGDEDRMAPPRGLAAVLVRVGGRESGGDEIRRVRHDFRQAPRRQIIAFLRPEVEARAET